MHAGEFAAASALSEEADAIAEATGNVSLKYPSLMLAAWRGAEVQTLMLIEAGVRDATARGEGSEARSRALLSDGQAADALYREAIDRFAPSRIAVHLAQAHPVYGEGGALRDSALAASPAWILQRAK